MKILLSLDLSTNCTGWATFNCKTRGLLEYGIIEPINAKGYTRLRYPQSALYRIISMAEQVSAFIIKTQPDQLIIEEVNRGISRTGQKSLDALHFFVLFFLITTGKEFIDKVQYVDSNGKKGWRTKLGLKLTDLDKLHNKEVKKWNKNKKNRPKKVVINWKHLAARFVKQAYGIVLDVDALESNGDLADAISIGTAHLN